MSTMGATGGCGDGDAGGSGGGSQGRRVVKITGSKNDIEASLEPLMLGENPPLEPANPTPRGRATLPHWAITVVEGTGPRSVPEAMRAAAVRLAPFPQSQDGPPNDGAPPAPARAPTPGRVHMCCCDDTPEGAVVITDDHDDCEKPVTYRATVVATPFPARPYYRSMDPLAPPFDPQSEYWMNRMLDDAVEAYSAFFRRRGFAARNRPVGEDAEMGEEVVDVEKAAGCPADNAPNAPGA